jgi:WD40 repeat protein
MDSTNQTNHELVRWTPATDFIPQPTPLTELPFELFIEIMSHLRLSDMINFAMTCRHTTWVCAANQTWRDLVRRHFSQFPRLETSNYFEKYVIYSNFLENTCHTLVLKGHTRHITCYAIDEMRQQLVSGSWDNSLKVWDLKTGECLATLQGHITQIINVVAYEGKMVSISRDGCMKLWDLENKNLIKTKEIGEEMEVLIDHLALSSDGKRLVLGRSSTTQHHILVLDTDINIIETIEIEQKATAIAFDGKRIIFGLVDGTLAIYDCDTKDMISSTLEKGHPVPSIHSIAISGNVVISSSDDSIRRWDLETLAALQPIDVSAQSLTGKISLWEGALIANCWHNPTEYAVLWDLKTSQAHTVFQVKSRSRKTPILFYQNWAIMSSESNIQVVDMNRLEEQVTYKRLKHLGILTAKDYIKELGCQPEDLPKIGIKTFEDVEIVCGKTAAIQPLEIIQIEELEEDPRRLQSMAWDRRDALKAAVDKMSKAIKETKSICPLLQPWQSVQGMWDTIEQGLQPFQELIETSNTPATLLENFSFANYNKLAADFNHLVDLFKEYEKTTQLTRLKRYILQGQLDNMGFDFTHLINVWERNRGFNFTSISSLSPANRQYNNLIEIYSWEFPEEG